MRTLAALALIGGLIPGVATANQELVDCLAVASDSAAILECQILYGSEPSQDDPSGSNDPTSLEIYDFRWLPACPEAIPTRAGADQMFCAAMSSCADASQVRLTLWARQRTDAAGDPVAAGWQVRSTECRDNSDIGRVRRQLGWTDVFSEIRRIGVPAGVVKAPGYTLVNLDTTFYTEPQTIDRTLRIIGYTVDVQVEPASYAWHWGDGSADTTRSPGEAYPSTDVTHAYLHATHDTEGLSLRVDVTYSARYRVDGGDWLDIPDTITITGPSTAMPIKQASSVLVQPH